MCMRARILSRRVLSKLSRRIFRAEPGVLTPGIRQPSFDPSGICRTYREAVTDHSPGLQPWVNRTKPHALKAPPTPRTRGAIPNWRSTPTLQYSITPRGRSRGRGRRRGRERSASRVASEVMSLVSGGHARRCLAIIQHAHHPLLRSRAAHRFSRTRTACPTKLPVCRLQTSVASEVGTTRTRTIPTTHETTSDR